MKIHIRMMSKASVVVCCLIQIMFLFSCSRKSADVSGVIINQDIDPFFSHSSEGELHRFAVSVSWEYLPNSYSKTEPSKVMKGVLQDNIKLAIMYLSTGFTSDQMKSTIRVGDAVEPSGLYSDFCDKVIINSQERLDKDGMPIRIKKVSIKRVK